jgi:Trypsin
MPARRVLAVLAACVAAGASAAPSHAIFNGTPATIAEVPFAVQVHSLLPCGLACPRDEQLWFPCTGALLAPDVVLTAAHCVYYDTRRSLPAQGIVVHAGSAATVADPTDGLGIEAIAFESYPGWRRSRNGGAVRGDAAIVRLAEPVAGVPIALAPRGSDALRPGAPLLAAGWGYRDPDGKTDAAELRRGTLEVARNRRCARLYEFRASTMFCAGGGEAATCEGDSGGPVWSASDGAPVLVGLVSWGPPCRRLTAEIETRVAAGPVRRWLDGVLQ